MRGFEAEMAFVERDGSLKISLREVSLVRRSAVKALMWTISIVEVEIASNGAAGFTDALVSSQIHFLVFDASPQTLNKHVVSPSPLAIHADCNSLVGKH